MSTARLVLTVDLDGTGECLYSDLIDLRTLGVLSCRRASHIEFAPVEQDWTVLSPDRSRILFRHPSRTACLQWEARNLQPG